MDVRIERGYIECKSTCDAWITEGVVSMQPAQVQLPPGAPQPQPQLPALPNVATLEVTEEGWQKLA